MSWMNEDMDDLFRELADQQSFRYRKAYFRDIERYLPIRKSRKPIIGLIGLMSVLLVGVLIFVPKHSILQLKNASAKHQSDFSLIPNLLRVSKSAFQRQGFLGHIGNKNEKGIPNNRNTKTSLKRLVGIGVDRAHNFILSFPDNNEMANVNTPLPTLSLKPVELSTNNGHPLIPLGFSGDFKCSPWSMVLSAYGGVSQGWTRESTAATNASIGFQTKAKYALNRLSILAGLGVEWTRFDQLNIMERTKIYGLSSQLMENSYAFKSMTSVQIPVEVSYTMGRHQFGVGISGIFNTIAKVKRSCSLDGEGIYNLEGFTDTKLFGTFHLQTELQYQFNVSENLSIGVEAGIRITDPILSDRMEGEYVKRPVFVNFVLSKSLTKEP